MSLTNFRTPATQLTAEHYSVFAGLARIQGDPSIRAVFKVPGTRDYITLTADEIRNIALPLTQWALKIPGEPGHVNLADSAAKNYIGGYNQIKRAEQLMATRHGFRLTTLNHWMPTPEAASIELPKSLQKKNFAKLLIPKNFKGWAQALLATYKPGSDFGLIVFNPANCAPMMQWIPVRTLIGQAEDGYPKEGVVYSKPRGLSGEEQQAAASPNRPQMHSRNARRPARYHGPQMRG